MEGTSYEDEYVKFTFQDGILFTVYKAECIDLKIAKHITTMRLEHVKQKEEYPLFSDFTVNKETTKDARDYFATLESTKGLKSIAVLSNSKVINMLYNFYVVLSKPPVPTKLFASKDEALNWLKNFL